MPPPRLPRFLVMGLVVGLIAGSSAAQDFPPDADVDPPLRTAGAELGDDEVGVLAFRLSDENGKTIPGRLTFVQRRGEAPDLFPNTQVAPDDLAIRKNVVYALHGHGRITVPIGTYAVYASRGIEWSVVSRRFVFVPDSPVDWQPKLTREVDTTGWISGDFHLHTLTHSGHGDSNMNERLISLIGEGVEFAVATDHNHHTDYGPTVEHLDAHAHVTHVTGNEVSVPIGHFNAFPLDPAAPPVASDHADANELFTLLRGHENAFDVVPVIQVNHPRWDGIDYFRVGGLDHVTGTSDAPTWSDDFDTVEVFNENVGWGYYTPHVDRVDTGGNLLSVLRDWYNLLNRGHRAAAVGNSDSHTVHYAFAGYPRNYVRSSTDDAGAIDVVEVAAELRERRVFTTIGPFVEYSVNGVAMGGRTEATDGTVEVAVRVQAASWIACDRVKIVVNGDVVETIRVPPSREPLRLDTTHTLALDRDAWVAVLVEGDRTLDPIVASPKRPARPLAVCNPVWVDADGDGAWTSPWDQALAAVAAGRPDLRAFDALPATRQGLLVRAAVASARPFAADLIRHAMGSLDRLVILAAARAAERLGDAALRPDLEAAAGRRVDPYLHVALLRAIAVLDREQFTRVFAETIGDADEPIPGPYLAEIASYLGGRFVTDWTVIGYFDAPAAGTVTAGVLSPETDADAEREHTGKDGAPLRWQDATAAANGHVDLRGLAGEDAAMQENAIAFAQTWLHTPDDREVTVTLGTDDGCRVFLNDAIVYDNIVRRGASPLEHVARWRLRKGWNRVLFKVENGTGGFGLYFRVLDDTVTAARAPK